MARWVRLIIISLIVIGSGSLNPTAVAEDQQVDLLLVLAADVSRSVDEQKFKLQRDGYSNAIADPRVIRAMTAGPAGRIALCYFEWSGENEQNVIVDWVTISGENDAREVAGAIRYAPRAFAGRTSISAAIDYAIEQLARTTLQSPRRIINVSGDGTNNAGREITRARDDALAKDVTINGLAILSEVPLWYCDDLWALRCDAPVAGAQGARCPIERCGRRWFNNEASERPQGREAGSPISFSSLGRMHRPHSRAVLGGLHHVYQQAA